MVKETNPSVWAKAQSTLAPHSADHGYRTIADIMTALNPFTGDFYRETLVVSRYTREMFALMEGRHVHPSTLYPGGVGTTPLVQLFTDYLMRLVKYVEFMKKCVPLHDDLFDFFYEALPGYEEVGTAPEFTKAVEPGGSLPRRKRLWLSVLAALLCLCLASGAFEPARRWIAGMALPAARDRSIAVLPFQRLGPTPDYFSDGFTEELIHALGQTQGIRVLGPESSFTLNPRHNFRARSGGSWVCDTC